MRFESNGFVNRAASAEQFPGSLLSEQAEFGDNPANLRMFRYVPPDLARRAPLVVILHGCLQTAPGYDRGTGWSTLAQRFGFALLAPGQNKANNPNGCFNWFLPEQTRRGHGEVASIRQMIERMVEDHALDPKRIFVTGLSAGGAMTGAMLANYPEVFAGGAIIAGLPFGAAANLGEAFAAMHRTALLPPRSWGDAVRGASAHAGPWPRISVWHGDADSTVTYSNMDAIIAQWRDVHGLSQPPREVDEAGHVHRSWYGAGKDAVIEAYTIKGLGHGTPIRAGSGAECCGEAGPFILEAGISSSYRIAEFFGLTRKRSVAGKIAQAVIEAVNVEVVEEEPVVPASIVVTVPEPAPEAKTISEPFERMIETAIHDTSGGDLRRIIVKALKAAGLIKDA